MGLPLVNRQVSNLLVVHFIILLSLETETICIDQTRRTLVIVLPCYGALEIVGVVILLL